MPPTDDTPLRLFVAVVPPPEVVTHLDASVRPIRDDTLRWSGTHAWHVTLAFYGDIDPGDVDELGIRIARAARRHPPAQLQVTGAGRFGSTVLWAGITGDVAVLGRQANAMAAAGRRLGAGPDRHDRFRPHITLARARRPVDLRPYVARLADYAGPSWAATEVVLFSSHADARPGRGPRYEALGRYRLEGVTARRR
ncbi:RNA 2',3'-cyclic phosphodiesterase [Haloactinopolyspora sp.]|uniref:RNA 2',3'-cyclic phosphodiesterase n=1 Tax=Haloactinopolyspora sp. TaxID=1966353 RepID=UPI0026325B1B|nr:RNA 2',3'-cyclic phosphodiesterase [Haloactinopolyspora sp.]